MTTLYRKRLIPDECICLNNDLIVYQTKNEIITSWQTLNPKIQFSNGLSYYIIDKGWKISKFYNKSGDLVYIYCDIIDTIFYPNTDEYVFTDLLADVIIENNGFVRVVDLDELAEAYKEKLLSSAMLTDSLEKLNELLSIIYDKSIHSYLKKLDEIQNALS